MASLGAGVIRHNGQECGNLDRIDRYNPDMTRQPLSILILMAIIAQAVLGGFGGTTSLCFGGGHEIEHEEAAVTECGHGCSHESAFPTPVPVNDDSHGDDCPCTDVRLDLLDLMTRHRTDADAMQAVSVVMPDWIIIDHVACQLWQCAHRVRQDDPGGRQRLAPLYLR